MTAAAKAFVEALGIVGCGFLVVFALRGPTERVNAWCRRRDAEDEWRWRKDAYQRIQRGGR